MVATLALATELGGGKRVVALVQAQEESWKLLHGHTFRLALNR